MWFSVAGILLFVFCSKNLILVFCGTNRIDFILWHVSYCPPPAPLLTASSCPPASQPTRPDLWMRRITWDTLGFVYKEVWGCIFDDSLLNHELQSIEPAQWIINFIFDTSGNLDFQDFDERFSAHFLMP